MGLLTSGLSDSISCAIDICDMPQLPSNPACALLKLLIWSALLVLGPAPQRRLGEAAANVR